jgi:GNAT superfamily N-acetyltransferase
LADRDATVRALSSTRCGFLVEKDGKTVGMATAHGDGVLYFYIQDVIIHPDHQGQGLGRRLMDAVMRHIDEHAADKAYVALFSRKGLEPFYAQYGFIARPLDNSGPGMFFIKGVKEGARTSPCSLPSPAAGSGN